MMMNKNYEFLVQAYRCLNQFTIIKQLAYGDIRYDKQ